MTQIKAAKIFLSSAQAGLRAKLRQAQLPKIKGLVPEQAGNRPC